jgi:hypothetical protein
MDTGGKRKPQLKKFPD